MSADGLEAALVLGRQIAVGGEGEILEVVGQPGLVAKRYLRPLDPEATEKLKAMVSLPAAARPACAVWPQQLLQESGRVIGFVMPRVEGRRDLHALSAPTARRKHFPTADYRFLVAVAANLARAVAAVHAAGHVIGDVNDRFAMVGPDATIILLDTDSYQIEVAGRVYACNVGVPMFQPPELQSAASYRGLPRTRNHDAFGLAVLIFQLLFLNRHPFAGRPLRGEVPEIPMAIRNHQFAYGSAARQRGLFAPPHALSLVDVGSKVAEYFEIAFGPQAHSSPGPGRGRPSAAAWALALDQLGASLRACAVNDGHWHLGGACPLCAIEGAIETLLFLPRSGGMVGTDAAETARRLWARIAAVTPPLPWGDPPEPGAYRNALYPTPYPVPRPPVGFWQRLGASIGLWSDPAISVERRRRQAAVEAASAEWRVSIAQWGGGPDRVAFDAQLTALRKLRDELNDLPKLRASRLAQLQASAHDRQLYAHLENYELADARIRGIGPALSATLEAAGFETAADCTKAALAMARERGQLPGIGQAKLAEIEKWRAAVAARFVFDPSRLVTAGDLQQLNGEMTKLQKGLSVKMEQGLALLSDLARRADDRRALARQRAEAAARTLAQAEIDLVARLPD